MLKSKIIGKIDQPKKIPWDYISIIEMLKYKSSSVWFCNWYKSSMFYSAASCWASQLNNLSFEVKSKREIGKVGVGNENTVLLRWRRRRRHLRTKAEKEDHTGKIKAYVVLSSPLASSQEEIRLNDPALFLFPWAWYSIENISLLCVRNAGLIVNLISRRYISGLNFVEKCSKLL